MLNKIIKFSLHNRIVVLVASVLLMLGGCSAQPAPENFPAATVQTVPAQEEPMSLYVPDHPLEQSAPGALRVYPLRRQAHGILAMGSNLIALCGSENTTLTLLTGEDLAVSATAELSFHLSEDDPSLRICPDALSYFDPVRGETVVLVWRTVSPGVAVLPLVVNRRARG